jgi:hypothetical protein
MNPADLTTRNRKLAELGFESYGQYIDSWGWRKRRAAYYAAKGSDCLCGAPAQLVHHKTYETLGAETPDDLVGLCGECHGIVHSLVDAGLLTLDPADLIDGQRAAAYRRERISAIKKAQSESVGPADIPPLSWDAREHEIKTNGWRVKRRRIEKAKRELKRLAREQQDRDAA